MISGSKFNKKKCAKKWPKLNKTKKQYFMKIFITK